MRRLPKELVEYGMDFSADLLDADIQNAFGKDGLGGCKPYSAKGFNQEYIDLIELYINNDDVMSVEVMYLAMERKLNEIKTIS